MSDDAPGGRYRAAHAQRDASVEWLAGPPLAPAPRALVPAPPAAVSWATTTPGTADRALGDASGVSAPSSPVIPATHQGEL